MPDFDAIIHQPARLQIMAALCQLHGKTEADFGFLKEKLNLTDGNLGAHLSALEKAAYVGIDKTFVARRPKTFVFATTTGRKAFEQHVSALRAIIK